LLDWLYGAGNRTVLDTSQTFVIALRFGIPISGINTQLLKNTVEKDNIGIQ
jgi:hypothetical protein